MNHFKTPAQVEAMRDQPQERYVVTKDDDYGGRYLGQTGLRVRSFQEAVVLRMDDGREACFHWMDVDRATK